MVMAGYRKRIFGAILLGVLVLPTICFGNATSKEGSMILYGTTEDPDVLSVGVGSAHAPPQFAAVPSRPEKEESEQRQRPTSFLPMIIRKRATARARTTTVEPPAIPPVVPTAKAFPVYRPMKPPPSLGRPPSDHMSLDHVTHSNWRRPRHPCRRFNPGDNVHVDIFDSTNDTTFPEGTVINLRCESGYHMRGRSRLLCVGIGWFGKLPRCEQYSCRRFRPGPHLHVDMFDETNITAFPEGTVINFFCDDSYRIQGNSISKCHYRDWLGRLPTCEENSGASEDHFHGQGCSRFETEPHLYVNEFRSTNDRVFRDGTIITYRCETGYALNGPVRSICSEGLWVGRTQTCQRQGCSRFETEPHLYVSEFRSIKLRVFPDGAIITYGCETGYVLNGTSRSICSEGLWLGSTPTCERFGCSRFETEPHLYVKEFQGTYARAFRDGAIVTFGCETGYVLFGPRSSMCTRGVWVGRKQKCEEVKCGLLKAPPNGYMNTTNSTAVGVKASFGCNNGYTLVGSAERLCLEDGQWAGTPARCLHTGIIGAGNRVFCPDPGTPDNGSHLLEGHFEPGSNVSFGCNPSYHPHGERTLECLPDGNWSSTPPHCISPYYFDKIEVVRENIESVLNNPPDNRDEYVYLAFDNLSTIGPDNFRHVIMLAKAVTRKLFATAEHYHLGVITFGANVTVVVDPAEPMNLDETLERLDQVPYTYGTAASTEFPLGRERKAFRSVSSLVKMERGPYRVFSVMYGAGDRHPYSSPSQRTEMYFHRVRRLSIGIRGDSDDPGVWFVPQIALWGEKFMVRDYDAIKLLAEAIEEGILKRDP